jgi:hypothetical protein
VYKHALGKGIYFELEEDLKRYWSQIGPLMARGVDSEESFVTEFYLKLAENHLTPSRTFSERAKQILEFGAVNIPRSLAFFLLPMWVGLAQSGWRLTGDLFGDATLADNDVLVYSSALSSFLFYMRGSGTFAPSVAKFHEGAKEHLASTFENLLPPAFAKGATYVSLAAMWGLILFAAGCSGSGFAVVMHDQLHPEPGMIPVNSTDPYAGFGTVAAPLFKVVPFEWAFQNLIVPMGGYSALTVSGVFINEGSFLSFMSDCWKIQKDNYCLFRQALLKKMLGIEPKKAAPVEEGVAHAAVPVEDLPSPQSEAIRKKIGTAVENRDFSKIEVTTDIVKAKRAAWCCAMFLPSKTEATGLAESLVRHDTKAAMVTFSAA